MINLKETRVAILDEFNVVLCVTTLSKGTNDIIKYSTLKVVCIGDHLVNVGAPLEPIEPRKHSVGDHVFVYMYRKNFIIHKFHIFISKAGTPFEIPELLELNPQNPKFPVSIMSYECNYPIVKYATDV